MLKAFFSSFCFLLCSSLLFAQTPYYYPPNSTDEWVETSPATLGWNSDYLDTLYHFLEEKNSKGFIILHEGRIAAEKYFGTFTKDSLWYWASAGKSLTAFLMGMAQQDGFLNIHDASAEYLGTGWTGCNSEAEAEITLWHQLTMTTGLQTTGVNLDCTLPECLNCAFIPGERWFYHNAPYTLLEKVLENATGQNINQWTNQKLRNTIGLEGFWLKLDYNNVRFGKTRDMARFGLLALSRGNWNGEIILEDTAYFNQMVSSSQNLNPSYGYLWWINGKDNYIPPGMATSLPGPLIPSAPADMFAALGVNDQKIYVVPSLDLVVVRCGNAADEASFALSTFDDDLWKHLQKLISTATAVRNSNELFMDKIYPNPVEDEIYLTDYENENLNWRIYSLTGQLLMQGMASGIIGCTNLAPGTYLLDLSAGQNRFQKVFIKR